MVRREVGHEIGERHLTRQDERNGAREHTDQQQQAATEFQDPGKARRQRVLGGMGIAIMSTSRGVVTSRTAEAEGIGGEVLCYVW